MRSQTVMNGTSENSEKPSDLSIKQGRPRRILLKDRYESRIS